MTTAIDSMSRLDLLGRYQAGTEGAATEAIFEGEGARIVPQQRRRRAPSPQYRARFSEAMRLYERVISGDMRAALDLTEALTRSDFAFLFGDIIDRQLLAGYLSTPARWEAVARRGRVRDFRTAKRFTLDGGNGLLDKVGELAPYPVRAVADGGYEYAVEKRGGQISISWETLVNDDLDAFRDLPGRLGEAARRSEEHFATSLFVSAGGPNSTFFHNDNKNKINSTVGGAGVPTNPALTVQGMQFAFQIMGQQVDSEGGPISVDGVVLMVPPALKMPAMNLINATEIRSAAGGGDGTGNDQLTVANWLAGEITVVVNPWLPIINTTSGNSAWYLFANPAAGRPALEVGRLIGHETPELWLKAPDAMRVGGGMVAPEEGDFIHDGIRYRVRHVFGGTLMDPKMAVASTGTGS